VINFFVSASGQFGIRDYLTNRGRDLAERVRVVLYEDLAGLTTLDAGGTIFAALDQVSPVALSTAAGIRDQLRVARAGVPVLNSPAGSLRRYDLLRRLHESGCNRFNVIRGTDDPGNLHYPVFIRYEHRHNGSQTPLLGDRRALDHALAQLVMRGARAGQLLVVEFCDTKGSDGLYRKYSAMRIGDRVVPRHMHASTSWVAKSESSEPHERLVREELDYLSEHPHERWIRDVFALAQIEYGRIDYGVCNGQPQVWEINTNPTLGRHEGRRRPDRDHTRRLREPGRAQSHRLMLEAFKALDRATASAPVPIAISDAERARLRAEAAARRPQPLLSRVASTSMAQAVRGALRPVLAYLAPAVARIVRSRTWSG
jgi:hypothetical protein